MVNVVVKVKTRQGEFGDYKAFALVLRREDGTEIFVSKDKTMIADVADCAPSRLNLLDDGEYILSGKE